MRRPLAILAVLGAIALGCRPNTTRPYFAPVTGAPAGEIELGVKETTEALADVFRTDSFPVGKLELEDGYLETAWFDIATRRPTSRRVLGPGVVQIRAWVDPARTNTSRVTVETVYRPVADPSLTGRQLDRQVPPDHPIGKRVVEIVEQLAKLYAGTANPFPAPAPAAPPKEEEEE